MKNVAVNLNRHDISRICIVLAAEFCYERRDDVQYITRFEGEERKAKAAEFEKQTRFLQEYHTRLIVTITRQMKKRSGGIYRRDWAELEKSCVDRIRQGAEEVIKEGYGDTSTLS